MDRLGWATVALVVIGVGIYEFLHQDYVLLAKLLVTTLRQALKKQLFCICKINGLQKDENTKNCLYRWIQEKLRTNPSFG